MHDFSFQRHLPGTLAVPLFLIAAGVLLLLSNLGFVWIERVWDLWPLAVMAAGVEQLLSFRGRW
jgi:hypothetical protein